MTILVKNILLRTFSKEEIEMAKKKPWKNAHPLWP
jgi:hypothetical protein